MVVALKPLYDLSPIKRVVVSTYQAASGAGAPAMAELYDQTRAFLDGTPEDELEISAFAHRIAFNTIPHIDVFLDDGSTKEEWKMVVETQEDHGRLRHRGGGHLRARAGAALPRRGHQRGVRRRGDRGSGPRGARGGPGRGGDGRPGAEGAIPMPGLLAGTDGTFVGRLRKDPTVPHGIAFWDVADQIRKGAALNAVQIAQLLLP